MLINWNALQPYKTKKDKSFEQLCYQIARKLYAEQGTMTSIDDSGGGDGIEFYLTLPDQTQYGWQAKYYEGNPVRLSSSRKTKIKESLKKSLKIHPNLNKWFLCLPMVLTVNENKWINEELRRIIPDNRKMEIILWHEDELHGYLNKPEFNGLKQAFFNELELSSDWFNSRFENLSVIVKAKFDKELYTENSEFFYYHVNPILINHDFKINRIAYYPKKLKELHQQGIDGLVNLQCTNEKLGQLFNNALSVFQKISKIYLGIQPQLDERLNQLCPNRIFEIGQQDYASEIDQISGLLNSLDEFKKEWYNENIMPEEEKEHKKYKDQARAINPMQAAFKELLEELKYYVSHSTIPLEMRIAHYLGNAGDGKTNFCLSIVRQHLANKLPAIFIPAIKLGGDLPLSSQITELLDIDSAYTFSNFLETLDTLGKIYNIRVPFIIDGLNEAIDKHGHLNNRLHLDMGSIETELLNYKNIVLITTCRPSYQAEIWGTANHQDNYRFHNIYGFTNIADKKKMVNRYFKEYKIQADLSFLSLEKFTKPIYLKIFCESVNPDRKNIVSVTLGYDSVYTIFDLFIGRCNQNIYQRLLGYGKIAPISKFQKLASQVMQKLGKQLWEHPSRGIEIEKMIEIADGTPNVDYQHSVTKALFDEELLVIRNWQNGKDLAYMTYDMIAGYFIAKHLISGGIADYTEYFIQQTDSKLFGQEYGELHPNHEDILAALLSMLPIKKGIFVHDIIGRPPHRNSQTNNLFGRSILTMMLLSPEYITPLQVKLVKDIATRPQNLPLLLKGSEGVRFVSDHPFNFMFWDPILFELPMNIRDLYWSEYLRGRDDGQLIEFVTELQTLQQIPKHTEEQSIKMQLLTSYLCWTLTSSVPSIKKLASDGIFEFGIRYPDIICKQYFYSAGINDPTVFEWMSSILYNILTTILKSNHPISQELLLEIYEFISRNVISQDGKHATNHLLTRNYNYNIIRLLERRTGGIIRDCKSERLKIGFKTLGITKWNKEKDRNENEYQDGNALIDYFFNKNKMPEVMVGKGSEYQPTPEYKQTQAKLRWRAYQLGYDYSLFGDIDKTIARLSRFREENHQTFRYADKYIEIAHFEYCGYLDGLGKFKNHEDFGYIRKVEPKHDPNLLFEKTDIHSNERYVNHNYINSHIPLKEHCSDQTVPNVQEYLTITKLGARTGNFVLLNGDISQVDQVNERQIFVLMDVVFIKNKNLKRAREAFTHPKGIDRGPESKPIIRHVLKNEIPDADIIPHNSFTTWIYSIKEKPKKIKYSTISLYKKDKKLSEKQADKIWNRVLKSNYFMAMPRKILSGTQRVMINFNSDKGDSYEKALNSMGIEIREEIEIVTEQTPINQNLDIFIPVTDIEGEYYVCKNIIDSAKLRTNPGSTDLFDNEGVLRAFTHTARIKYRDGEQFTYLDKSVLDSYLKENGLNMFWLIWGERDFYPADGDWNKNPKTMPKRKWSKFYKAVEYKY